MQEDDRLVKCIRAMDDTALLIFATHPTAEREEWLTECLSDDGRVIAWPAEQVAKVVLRLRLEAKAIARVRFMQADAMITAGAEHGNTENAGEPAAAPADETL